MSDQPGTRAAFHNSEKQRIVRLLRSDLYRLDVATRYDENGDVDNTYVSPGGIRVRAFGPNDAPHVIGWNSVGTLFDLDPATAQDVDEMLP